MNNTTEAVFHLLRSALFRGELPQFSSDMDWSAIYDECCMHAIDTLFSGVLKDLPVSKALERTWQIGIIKNILMCESDLQVLDRLHHLFEANEISYAVLKGMAAAKYYPQAYIRTCGDIDILVRRSQFERAVELLASSGFTQQKADESDTRHVSFKASDTLIELHQYFDMTDSGNKEDAALNRLLSAELGNTVVNYYHPDGRISETEGTGLAFRSFRDAVNGLVILYHLCSHLALGIGYRQIVDFLMFSLHYLTDEAWVGDETHPSFREMAKSLDLDVLAKTVVRAGQLYLGFPASVTWCKEADDGLSCELMEYVACKGNFGCKYDSEKNNRTIEILNTSRGSLRTRLDYETKIGLDHWPAARKNSFLRRFAWICGGCHHVKMLFKLHLVRSFVKDFLTSRKQTEMLNRLHVMRFQQTNRADIGVEEL